MRIAKRTIMVWLGVAAMYFAAGEAVRHWARATLEREMYASFQENVCPSRELEGEVCAGFPNIGKCVSGEYIDFRTVWKRVHGRQAIYDLLAAKYREFDQSKQRLANWLACQGFRQIRVQPALKHVGQTGMNMYFAVNYIGGYSIWTTENWPWPIRPIAGVDDAVVTIAFRDGVRISNIAVGTQRLLY